MEEWKQIEDYDNYEISNLGNVRNKKTNKLLKPHITIGYYDIILSKNNKIKHFKIHRLIAIAFIPNPNNFPIIDHIDKNRLNNSIDNLRWVSSSQNNYNRNMKTHSSKYRGVSWSKKRNKWIVQLSINGKNTNMGGFETEEKAVLAFNEFVISHNLQEFINQ